MEGDTSLLQEALPRPGAGAKETLCIPLPPAKVSENSAFLTLSAAHCNVRWVLQNKSLSTNRGRSPG